MSTMAHDSATQETTLKYYEDYAEEFINDTQDVDMSQLYKPFLELLPESGSILDAGCGSGRDTTFFKRQGFEVVSFDNSPEIVRIASSRIGHDILLLSFYDIAYHEEFDGVWACASTLHLPAQDMPMILSKLSSSLKRKGVLYTSYKYGEGEEMRGGRHFSNYTIDTLEKLMGEVPELHIIQIWKTNDVRPDRQNEQWINALLRKE